MSPRLPMMPASICKLPKDERGYPIPWFVATLPDGTRDFRIVHPGQGLQAYKGRLCWICGQSLGRYGAFVIGPMCAVNRVSSEPPSHPLCASFAAKACPFLTQPRRIRDKQGLPEELTAPGIMIERNPGVTLVWWSMRWTPFRAGDGFLFNIGEPLRTLWFREGRPASRAEVLESVESGMPALQALADQDGVEAKAELRLRRHQLELLLPSPGLREVVP